MLVGAMGDAHGGRFLPEDLGRQLEDLDLLLLAGDITDRNSLEGFDHVLGLIREHTHAPIVSIFGNDEYSQDRERYRERFDITFLDDQAIDLEVRGITMRIVGTTGSLDRPTWWQRTNLPNIWKEYRDRVSTLDELLQRDGRDLLILLSHYAPTYLTLAGEREKAFPEMGSRSLEKVLLRRCPDLVLHAHAHAGTPTAKLSREQRSLDDFEERGEIPIWNVSLPLNGKVIRFYITKEDRAVVTVQQR